ncbi:MAG TPA: peptide ABC transporter substrate-binding protein [Caldilineaceae bacterium]|nr:peptide ABC transporter substrate-binding protein [Caldilineaceae bacterium]
MLLALAGILLLATLLGYSTYNLATVLVPDRGGVFREGVAGNPKYLNPLLCDATDIDLDLCKLLYRGLTQIDKQGRVVPDLAQDWTIEDGVVYTFRMRPDQYWHDGQQVTADDVVFTINILKHPEVYSLPDLTSLWRAVEVEKLDELTVRFRLSEPFTPFMDYTSIGLLPEHIWRNVPAPELATKPLNATPIGNGALRVVETAADHIRLEPSPFYRGQRPYLSALELRFYPDHASLFTAFLAGEIDGISQVLPQDLPAAAERDDLALFSAVRSEYLTIIFNLTNPDVSFLQEKAVRQALYYGLDRERLINEVAAGQGIIAHSLLLPENWAYHPGVKQYPYDPVLAGQLLQEAGWIDADGDGIREKDGKPLRFLLYSNDDPSRQALIEHIAGQWRGIGVEAVPTPVTFAGLVADFLNPRRFDAALIGWELTGDPDPYPLWHSTQAEGGGQNYSGWANEEADQLMEQARAITDEAERRALYARFQEIFAEEAPALLLYYPVYTYGVSTRVHNVQIGSLNQPPERFATFADWYILTRRVPANQVPPAAPPTPPGGWPMPEGESAPSS